MQSTIIQYENHGCQIVGNVNFHIGETAEVTILLPYSDFTIKGKVFEKSADNNSGWELPYRKILQRIFEICERLQAQRHELKHDFLRLQETLEKSNNTSAEDYRRNRNELMKVFMKRFIYDHAEPDENYQYERDAVYHYLCRYFAEHGKPAPLDFMKVLIIQTLPPPFDLLEEILKSYLQMTGTERIEMLTQYLITKNPTPYDWFLCQEFLTQHSNTNERQ